MTVAGDRPAGSAPGGLLILPSIHGVRPAITAAAQRLSGLGFDVTVDDPYNGRSTADPETAARWKAEWDREALLHHVTSRLEELAAEHEQLPVVCGFGWGASTGLHAVLAGAPARALVLFHRVAEVPASARLQIPVMIQCADQDPVQPAEEVQEAARALMAAGAAVQLRWQTTDRHLFTDPDLYAGNDRVGDTGNECGTGNEGHTPADTRFDAAEAAWGQVETFLDTLQNL